MSAKSHARCGFGPSAALGRFGLMLSSCLMLLALAVPALAADDHAARQAPLYHSGVDPDVRPPRPWEIDPGASEAAAKIAAFERFDTERWSQNPTANELAMDVVYYDIDVAIDYDTQTISGSVLARMRVDAASATEADLDLAEGMNVLGVTQNGSPVSYVHQNEIITVTLDGTYLQGEEVEIVVSYGGSPPSSYGSFGFDSHAGETLVWTLSEPFGARAWWPCDDWSDDKADSVDIRVTVPTGQVVASNGTLQSVTSGSGTDTYWWHEGYPIATYLVSLAIYPYTVFSDYYQYSPTDSMEIAFYIYPDHYNETLTMNLLTDDMIEFFAGPFGEYPFLDEKYGHAEFEWGGAMEHQTCTSMGIWAFNEATIAHELGHQWWGDLVTCADFHHIWLNEGFARYSEALWLEHQYGDAGFWGKMNSTRYYGDGTIYVPDLNDWGRIFSTNLTYNKASWVVHMLRGVLGEQGWVDFLAAYRAAYAYDSATTEGLQAVAESISGLDLAAFFQQWIYGEYYPTYEYAWESVDNGGQDELHLSIDQTQTNTGIFAMPMEIEVAIEGGGSEIHQIDNSLAHEDYVISISGPATAVTLDPNDWIPKRVVEPILNPTFSEGTLLVNGVHWDSYDPEVYNAYEAQAFWGSLEIDFWDVFDAPGGGYPSTLPDPLGHGRVPSDVLGSYANVIWIGNNYNGDIDAWINTSIMPYLEAGGNVLLMCRQGQDFLDTPMRDYLGVNLTAHTTLYNCTSVHQLFSDIGRIGTQSYCRTFDMTLTQETSELLYVDTGWNPDEGIGVIRVPPEGGSANPYGARFAFLSGRPYRWDHQDLALAVETIVSELFVDSAAVPEDPVEVGQLALRFANPALREAALRFELPRTGDVSLKIYDHQGRCVSTLVDGPMDAGSHPAAWAGRGPDGSPLPTGIYYVRLRLDDRQVKQPLLLLR